MEAGKADSVSPHHSSKGKVCLLTQGGLSRGNTFWPMSQLVSVVLTKKKRSGVTWVKFRLQYIREMATEILDICYNRTLLIHLV